MPEELNIRNERAKELYGLVGKLGETEKAVSPFKERDGYIPAIGSEGHNPAKQQIASYIVRRSAEINVEYNPVKDTLDAIRGTPIDEAGNIDTSDDSVTNRLALNLENLKNLSDELELTERTIISNYMQANLDHLVNGLSDEGLMVIASNEKFQERGNFKREYEKFESYQELDSLRHRRFEELDEKTRKRAASLATGGYLNKRAAEIRGKQEDKEKADHTIALISSVVQNIILGDPKLYRAGINAGIEELTKGETVKTEDLTEKVKGIIRTMVEDKTRLDDDILAARLLVQAYVIQERIEEEKKVKEKATA